MSTGWRGRRTGLVINDAHVTKDAGGYDNMESFWECALHGESAGKQTKLDAENVIAQTSATLTND